jgi:Histidine kinase-, DNA gyrase B-, and HSP90-like ATPase
MAEQANAFPRKHFFLEMFTRDISLEDCVLDLIDNSIDALVKTHQIDIASAIFKQNGSRPNASSLPFVRVSFSPTELRIEDNCGGIGFDEAQTDVFNFGHGPEPVKGQLGAYGIGLKRAIFKIGNDFRIESHALDDGFSAHLPDVRGWSEVDATLEDWTIPIKRAAASTSEKTAGTVIRIRGLRNEVRMRINDGALPGRLQTLIAQTYAFFLERHVRVYLNSKVVEPLEVPIGESKDITPGHDDFEEGGVRVRLFASLSSQPKAEAAGWYVLCNGRVVVHADKTELTGWSAALPQFHTKFVRFLGLAFFQSKNPLLLPWTTTKRGLNRESGIFQKARNRMAGLSLPILKFLSSMYPSELSEEPKERRVADTIHAADLRRVASKPVSTFKVKMPAATLQARTVRIQYDAFRADVERIKRHLRKPSMAANRVGKHTFDHFLKTECPE